MLIGSREGQEESRLALHTLLHMILTRIMVYIFIVVMLKWNNKVVEWEMVKRKRERKKFKWAKGKEKLPYWIKGDMKKIMVAPRTAMATLFYLVAHLQHKEPNERHALMKFLCFLLPSSHFTTNLNTIVAQIQIFHFRNVLFNNIKNYDFYVP